MELSPEQELALAEYYLPILKAQTSFYEFVKQAWIYVEGSTNPYIDNWHVGAVSEHLEAVYRGQIRRLIINIPPRTGKSNICSVMFPAWVWANDPSKKFLYASYGSFLSQRDSRRCRMLIASKWYQERWGHTFSILKSQDSKTRFDNDKYGFRIATSSGGIGTGEGGDFVMCLPYDSPIETDIGTLSIGYIVENEISCNILSYNHETGILEYREIEAYEKNPGRRLLEIDLGDRVIECTEEHPIYVVGKGYIPAKDVQVDDELLCL